MVHALQETRRVLRSGGTLIDLRPAIQNRAIELELAYARLHIGEIDSSATAADHQAADAALRGAVKRGFFQSEHDADFQLVIDMDSVDDLRGYAAGLRRSVLPDEVISRLEWLTADENDFIIRIRRQMTIARYRKTSF